MKLVKIASGKSKLKISKKEWTNIGKKAGWMKVADTFTDLVKEKANIEGPEHFNATLGWDEFIASLSTSDQDIIRKAMGNAVKEIVNKGNWNHDLNLDNKNVKSIKMIESVPGDHVVFIGKLENTQQITNQPLTGQI